ncbi:hypothetical protein BDN72DRAFT_904913 [Pluteus cervinus]|uniref:Uncharacterized protein n=1 Tax=Pluteus cervinus TaxID=181527 RepID=A0ACD3A455_9AGAR|nr:hypothetical protein BDN72DRAFT_904913 [Pluteus cervinus]
MRRREGRMLTCTVVVFCLSPSSLSLSFFPFVLRSNDPDGVFDTDRAGDGTPPPPPRLRHPAWVIYRNTTTTTTTQHKPGSPGISQSNAAEHQHLLVLEELNDVSHAHPPTPDSNDDDPARLGPLAAREPELNDVSHAHPPTPDSNDDDLARLGPLAAREPPTTTYIWCPTAAGSQTEVLSSGLTVHQVCLITPPAPRLASDVGTMFPGPTRAHHLPPPPLKP